MSKRTLAGLFAAALSMGCMITAAPAYAGPGDPIGCYQGVPAPDGDAQNIVTTDGLNVTFNPNGTVDAQGVLDYATEELLVVPGAYVSCVEGDTLDPAFCPVYARNEGDAWAETYPDGGFTVRGNEIASDVTGCI